MDVLTSIDTGQKHASHKVRLVDCDLHPVMGSKDHENSYLPTKWHEFNKLYSGFGHHPFANLHPYPGIEPNIARRDSYPEGGGLPGSSLSFMQEQHLDPYNIEVGILQATHPSVGQRNVEFGAALATAVNDWQIDEWISRDPRLRGSIVLCSDNIEASVAEIKRVGKNSQFAQLGLTNTASEPLGRRRYWPIYAAAQEYNLPIGIHTAATIGPLMGGAGWPSYHIQKQQLPNQGMEATLLSLVMEGVFAEFPQLRVMLVEGGFSWLPMAAWRMDKMWARMRSELPKLKRPPSEYISEQVWVSSQPMDVFEDPESLKVTMEWIGWDRVCFASDYPHWDFDDPQYLFPFQLTAAQEKAFFSDNARAVMRL